MSDAEWVTEERRLWDAMMYARPEIIDRRKNAKLIAWYKRHLGNAAANQLVRERNMIAEEQAVARSWRAYENWARH
jgi:hypothetical protein